MLTMKSPPAARSRSHSSRGLVAKVSSSSATHSPALPMRASIVAKRSSLGRLRDAEHLAEARPVAVRLQHRERQPLAVGAAVVVPERIGGVAAMDARQRPPEHQARRQAEPLQPRHRAQVRSVHLLAAPRALAREQRGEHAVGEHDRAHLIGDAARDGERRIVRLAGGQHDPGAREPEVVERGRAALRSLGSVAGRAGVDQARVARAQRRSRRGRGAPPRPGGSSARRRRRRRRAGARSRRPRGASGRR